MPFGDGTGPQGIGQMTGQGAGYCIGSVRPGFANPALGIGWSGFSQSFGRGVGRGRGRGIFRRGFNLFAIYPRW